MPTDTKWNFDWSGRMEQLEDRLFMSADPVGGFLGGAIEQHATANSPPPLTQHVESTPDFWIDSSNQVALENHLRQIDQALEEAHGQTGLLNVRSNYGFTGIGQTVAVIDSGIAYDQVALGGGFGANYRVVGGWDFTGENDADPYDDGPSGSHGTHVAGIIGGDSENDSGVAPGVDLVALRVFDDAGAGYFSWVENALDWVYANRDSFENPITTVNLSLGVASWNSETIPNWANLEDEFAQLESAGIFIAVSAGNSFTSFNSTGLSYPASSSYVIPVMSTDDSGLLSYFSQRSSRAIAAPGRWITSTVPDYAGNNDGINDDYASKSGTSMAAPYVAGASVIIREAMEFVGYTNITQDTIYDHMMATADSFFDSATNQSYSRLNVQAAVDALMPSDDFGSDIASAYGLGTISAPMSMSGTIATLSDVDYFAFTAANSGTVTFEATSTSNGLTASWLLAGTQSLGTQAVMGNSVTLDVVAGQEYTVGFTTGSGLGYYNFDVTSDSSFSFTDWGTVEFSQLANLSVSGETWYRFAATNSGFMTVDSTFDTGSGQVGLELYNSSLQLVDTGNAVNGTSRVDVYVAAGDELYVKAVGTNSNVDFRLTNLVSLSGTTVNVSGTSGDDVFAFVAGDTHQVSVNGVEYSFASIAVTDVNFDGGAGSDLIAMTGTAGDETAILRVGDVTLTGAGFTANAFAVENISVYGEGGQDRAYLYDSIGNDAFTATPLFAQITGTGFENRVEDFDFVYAYSIAGGIDHAYLYDSTGDDAFIGSPEYALMQGENNAFYNFAQGFDFAYAYSIAGGVDRAYLYDSSGNDTFVGSPEYALMQGENNAFYNFAQGFDFAYAYSIAGGVDRAILFDSLGDDTLRTWSNAQSLEGTGFYNVAFGFDVTNAYASVGFDQVVIDKVYQDESLYGRNNLIRSSRQSSIQSAYSFDDVSVTIEDGASVDVDINAIDYLYEALGA